MQTFIVRLWSPRDGSGVDREHVCGVVEQVGAEQSTTFANPEELIGVLRDAVSARTSARGGGPATGERNS
jgi:hypothetical protein